MALPGTDQESYITEYTLVYEVYRSAHSGPLLRVWVWGRWGLGFGAYGLGFGVWGLGFGVLGLKLRFWAVEFRAQVLGFGVWGSGLGV